MRHHPLNRGGEGRIRMTEKAQRVIHELIVAISSHDVEKLAALFTEDCLYEDVALGSVMRGREALKTGYGNLFASIPDFKLALESLFIADNWVGSEWVMTGTPTTGKSFSIRGASISELQGGKIKRNSDYYDPTLLLQQVND